MSDIINMEVLPDDPSRILTSSSLLKIGDRYYKAELLNPGVFNIEEHNNGSEPFTVRSINSFDTDIAYLYGDYYYLYRGKTSDIKGFDQMKPGIYYDDTTAQYMIKDPDTPEEKEEYKYTNKITTADADEIRNAVLNHEIIIFNVPDSSHSAIPPESIEDDILKKAIKRAIHQKGIDLDQYKTRFASKNMLFNTKQVLRGPNKLSILLFDRCADALNLKYTIILEENGGEIVGHQLKDKIIISSDDAFDANINVANDE